MAMQGLHRSVKQIVTSTPRASEAYISVEGRAKMILSTIAAAPSVSGLSCKPFCCFWFAEIENLKNLNLNLNLVFV